MKGKEGRVASSGCGDGGGEMEIIYSGGEE